MAFTYEEAYKELTNVKPDMKSLKENCLTFTEAIAYINECVDEEFYNLFKVVGVNEYAYFKETGRILIYEEEETAKSGFIANIGTFFKKIWAKIKAIFTGLIDKLSKMGTDKLEARKADIAAGVNNLIAKPELIKEYISGEVYEYNLDAVKKATDRLGIESNNLINKDGLTNRLEKVKNEHGFRFDDAAIVIIKEVGADVKSLKPEDWQAAKDAFSKLVKGEPKEVTPQFLTKNKTLITEPKRAEEYTKQIKNQYNMLKGLFAKAQAELQNAKWFDAGAAWKKMAFGTIEGIKHLADLSASCSSHIVNSVNQLYHISVACLKTSRRGNGAEANAVDDNGPMSKKDQKAADKEAKANNKLHAKATTAVNKALETQAKKDAKAEAKKAK